MITPLFVAGLLLSLLIGISLGLLGGGGSILTVPILHYVFGLDASESTALSLFIVGLTAALGSTAYARRKEIAWREGFTFAIPSLLAVLLVRRFINPHLPSQIEFLSFTFSKDNLILLVFSAVMLIAATAMIRSSSGNRDKPEIQRNFVQTLRIVSKGILVGVVTGFVGAGGGFLIVPALALLVGLDMKRAVGTSLVVIAVNSLIGFTGALSAGMQVNYPILAGVTSASLVGMFVGSKLVAKVSGEKLKPAFGWFVLIMGTFILLKETLLK